MTHGPPRVGGTTFDNPAAGTTSVGVPRVATLDITRAIALIGVVVMNYHGYLNGDSDGRDLADRVFDIGSGVLSTRFAAVFVVVAGASMAMLTSRSFTSGDEQLVRRDRRRLLRRGVVLTAGGVALEHAWPGTIIFYYGVYFVLASLFFTARNRMIIGLAVASAIGATAIGSWEAARQSDGHSTTWLHPAHPHSVREWIIRAFVDHTHPVLPWLGFLCLGILIGRNYDGFRRLATRYAIAAFAVAVAVYMLVTALDRTSQRTGPIVHTVTSMQPFSRGLPYTLSTAAIAVTVLASIIHLCESPKFEQSVRVLQRAGQMTLTLYLLHVLIFYVAVRWTHWVGSGLANALLLGLAYWVFALALGSWWHHRIGRGPAERIYRLLGG